MAFISGLIFDFAVEAEREGDWCEGIFALLETFALRLWQMPQPICQNGLGKCDSELGKPVVEALVNSQT